MAEKKPEQKKPEKTEVQIKAEELKALQEARAAEENKIYEEMTGDQLEERIELAIKEAKLIHRALRYRRDKENLRGTESRMSLHKSMERARMAKEELEVALYEFKPVKNS